MTDQNSEQSHIQVRCPHPDCGYTYKIQASVSGRKVRCTHCGNSFVVGKRKDKAAHPPRKAESPKAEPSKTGPFKAESPKSGSALEEIKPEATEKRGEKQKVGAGLTKLVVPAVVLLVAAIFAWSGFRTFKQTRTEVAAMESSVTYKRVKKLADEFQIIAVESKPGEIEEEPTPYTPPLRMARVVGTEVSINEKESAVLYPRRGQPVLLKDSIDGSQEVVVFLPENRISGYVDSRDVKEVETGEMTPADMLGYWKPSPSRHEKAVRSLTFRKDGNFLASYEQAGVHINLWHVPTASLIRSFEGHEGEIKSVAFLSDGRVASASADGSGARVWDPLTTATLRKAPKCKGVFFAAGPEGYVIEVSPEALKLWDLGAGEIVASKTVEQSFTKIRISSGGGSLAAYDPTNGLTGFSLPDLKQTYSHEVQLDDFDYSEVRNEMAVIPREENGIKIFNVETGKVTKEIDIKSRPQIVRFIRDSYVVVAAHSSRMLQFFSVSDPKEKRGLVGTSINSPVSSLAVGPNGEHLAIGHKNGSVSIIQTDEESVDKMVRQYYERFIEPLQQEQQKIYRLFRIALINGQRESAASYLAQLKRRFPEGDLTKKGKAEIETGIQAGSSTTPKGSTNPKNLYSFFHSFLLNNRPEDAKKYLEQLIRNHPDSSYTSKARKEMEKSGLK